MQNSYHTDDEWLPLSSDRLLEFPAVVPGDSDEDIPEAAKLLSSRRGHSGKAETSAVKPKIGRPRKTEADAGSAAGAVHRDPPHLRKRATLFVMSEGKPYLSTIVATTETTVKIHYRVRYLAS